MSKNLLGVIGVSAALLGAPLAASAADMTMPLKAPMPAPVMSWTGCYVDGGWGYGFWNQDHYFTDAAGSSVTTTDGGRGWMGKLGGGCDYQTPWFNNRVVVGVFGDWDPMSLKGTISPSELFPPVGASQPLAMNEKETSAWFVGARLGYLVTPSFMTYFDGGYTRTHFNTSAEYQTFTGTAIPFAYPNYNDSGWFLGSGFEYSLNDWVPFRGLFLQTEYRFSEYGRKTLSEFSTVTGLADGNTLTTRPYVQTVTTALVWKFNWTGR